MRIEGYPGEAMGGAPALILGSGITVLGVTRTLGRAGIPVLVASPSPGAVRHSRWFRALPRIGGTTLDDGLETLLRSGAVETAVLIPCSDHLAVDVARLAPDLKQRFPSFLSAIDTMVTLTEKVRFYRLLSTLNVPHPFTKLDPTAEEVMGTLADGSQTYFLKPYDSQSFFRKFGVKGVWLKGGAEKWPQGIPEMIRTGGLLIQEYVPGPPSNHYFIDGFADKDGEVLTELARRRLRMYPTDFGNSSYMVTVPLEEVRVASADLHRLLGAVGYRGVFSAEFKKDERDGVFRLLEINGRPWWFVEFAAQCGVDVATMAYQAALGIRQEAKRGYQVGRRLIHPYYDLQACWSSGPGKLRGLGDFASSIFGASQPLFSLSDPLPSVVSTAGFLSDFLVRRLKSLRPSQRRAHER